MGRRFETLDGLRGVAAAAVVLFHFGGWTGRPWLVPHGYLAVDFFFALSGFVLAHAYELKIRVMGLREFALRRVIRLWPLIVVGVALGWLQRSIDPERTITGWNILASSLAALVLVSRSDPLMAKGSSFPINQPMWSLGFEMIANAVWAVALPWLSDRVLGLVILLSGLCLLWLTLDTPLRDLGPNHWWTGLPRVAFAFGIGLACYRLRSRFTIGAPFWVLALIVGLFCMPGALPGWGDLAIVSVAFPAIILAGANSPSEHALIDWSGRISYPLYALHMPVGLMFGGALDWAVLPAILAASWVALVAFDEPLRAWMENARRSPIGL